MNKVFKIGKKSKQKHFFVSVLFMFFTSAVVFSQNTDVKFVTNDILINPNSNGVEAVPSPSNLSSELNSNMNFVLWFMGTKEDLNSAKPKETFYTKKSIITSGREPNRLLLKTLLKRAINIESC